MPASRAIPSAHRPSSCAAALGSTAIAASNASGIPKKIDDLTVEFALAVVHPLAGNLGGGVSIAESRCTFRFLFSGAAESWTPAFHQLRE